MEEVAAIAVAGFAATAVVVDRELRVEMRGTADLPAQPHLTTLLTKVHEVAGGRRLEVVAVDMRAVEFMSSGCMKQFVTWLLGIEDLERASQYRVRLVENPRHHWQHRSFEVLRSFAPDIVEIAR